MPRILIINPNTTQSVTDRVLASCREAHPLAQWSGITARFGAPYVASEATYAVAAHAVLDAFEAACGDGAAAYDAVLIACFGDPGLLALREVAAPLPVTGLALASLEAAALRGGPFAVVTGGAAWGPMLARFAHMHRLDAGLRGIHTVELTGAQIAAAPDKAVDALCGACERAVAAGAATVVLGGAALAGMAARLQPRVSVPLLDNVLLGAHAAVAAAASGPAG
jgi:Asp/Glu/hydantoin racemase